MKKSLQFGAGFCLVFLLFLTTSIQVNESDREAVGMMEVETAMAVHGAAMAVHGGRRRQLKSFEVCALCTCCGGARGMCLPSPCCYAINCNIPNRPFGFCSFSPRACNCFGCHT